MPRFALHLFGTLIFATCVGMEALGAETPVERGRYLVNSIMACGNCHTPQGPNGPVTEKFLSGGIRFDEPPFDVTASNITPHRTSGIGKWTDAEIGRAIADGVRPNGVPLAPVMPSAFYKALTKEDLNAVVAYLKTVRPQDGRVSEPVYRVSLPPMTIPGVKPMSSAELNDKIARGHYLATIGHCMECHTPMKEGRHDFNLMGKGGRDFPGPWGVSMSANISSHPTAGIGAWTDAEIKRAITKGIGRDGRKLKPPMAYAYYAKMTEADLDAMVAWLRTVKPAE
ncbi:MAG: c-type cytochrome [Pseudorhodoplanes sp.]